MDLRDFLNQLAAADQLYRIDAPVSADLELAARCRKEFRQPHGGRALFFAQVDDSPLQVAANLFGSEARMTAMLRSGSFPAFEEQLDHLLGQDSGTATERLLQLVDRAPLRPSVESDSSYQASALDLLPALRSWPKERGRYLTLALTVTKNPLDGTVNLGLYRAQLQDNNQIAINFAPGSGAAQHLATAEQLGTSLPVSLFCGSDPALLWAAAAPLPSGCDEFRFCRALFGAELRLSPCASQPLQVPADAELIIEGQIAPGARGTEGPFGNHSGRYVLRNDCPLLQVTAVRRREDAVVPLTVVGPPPSENVNLAKANLCFIRTLLRIDYPQILDLQMPLETIFHGAALVQVERQTLQQNRAMLDQLWKNSPLSRSRLLILLDQDIDLQNYSRCWWRALNQLTSKRIYQDHGRIAIDATGIDPDELIVEDQ